jgi:hypothetical protein
MLANALLDHHRAVCVPHTSRPPIVDRCVITYGDLCSQANVPGLERSVGHFLQEVAEWCAAHGYPPINALAVNADSRMPGEGYDLAPGCSIMRWPAEATDAIAFAGYPATAHQIVLRP